MKFDDILIRLGEFGYFQRRLFILLCMPAILNGCYMMILVFVMKAPEHRCKIPGYDNDTYAIQGEYHEQLINQTIPQSDRYKYDRCHMYVSPGNLTKVSCMEWVYDKTVFKQTFTSQHNSVCGDAILQSVAQMIFYFGVLVGDLFFGFVSDFIGRKKTFCMTIVVIVSAGFGCAFAPEFYSFVTLEFILGAGMHGCYMICCVLGIEMVGPNKRMWPGITIHIVFAVGSLYLAGAEYILREWSYVQIACTAPAVILLSYWWLISESPRWLTSKGKFKEAEEIMHTAAKVNKAKLPENIIDSSTIDAKKSGNIWNLFQSPILFARTMIIFYNWCVISMVYYGVTMHAGSLGGNFYLDFTILTLVDIPAKIATLMFLNRLGRRKLHSISMTIGGMACLCTIFTVIYGGHDLQPLTLTLAIIGKAGSGAAFGIIYIYSMELFPTSIRNSAMGMSSCIARVGGMLAPYIANSGDLIDGRFGEALPLVIFGASSVLAGILTLFLPETLNQQLPETLKDAEHFGRKKYFKENTVNVIVEEKKISPVNE